MLPHAEISFDAEFLTHDEANHYFQALLTETAWQEKDIFVFGKWRKQPRLTAWYGNPEAVYSYSGVTLQPTPWFESLQALRQKVEAAANAPFNSVLLNLYRNQNDSMGWHSDDEPELGPEPTIASVSLGERRDFMLQHKKNKALGIHRIPLTHGSLLVMSGPTQANWRHAIAKERVPMGQRINLTFRQITPTVR